MAHPKVRAAVIDDVPRLTEIYNHYIVNTPATFDIEPFTVEQRMEWFSHYATTGSHRVLVAVAGGEILGATWSSQFRVKRAYDTTVETSVYCAPESIGQGIGTVLYEALFRTLKTQPLRRAVAGITMPNEASVRLHERFGFRKVGTFSEVGKKFGRYWDVAWFEREL
jgi:phosphinothricin acetyltransferase